MNIKAIASTPPAIAILIGSVGLLSGMPNAGIVLTIGVFLQAMFLLV